MLFSPFSSSLTVYGISWIISTERQVAGFSVMQPCSSMTLNPISQCKYWRAMKISKFNLFFFMGTDVPWDNEVVGSHHCPYKSLLQRTLWQLQGPNLCPHERRWIHNSETCSMREYQADLVLLLSLFSRENFAHGLVIALVRGLQGLYLGGIVVGRHRRLCVTSGRATFQLVALKLLLSWMLSLG